MKNTRAIQSTPWSRWRLMIPKHQKLLTQLALPCQWVFVTCLPSSLTREPCSNRSKYLRIVDIPSTIFWTNHGHVVTYHRVHHSPTPADKWMAYIWGRRSSLLSKAFLSCLVYLVGIHYCRPVIVLFLIAYLSPWLSIRETQKKYSFSFLFKKTQQNLQQNPVLLSIIAQKSIKSWSKKSCLTAQYTFETPVVFSFFEPHIAFFECTPTTHDSRKKCKNQQDVRFDGADTSRGSWHRGAGR